MPRSAPTPVAPPARRFVALDALARALDGAEWAPLRLTTERRERPASPRLPHALLLHLAHDARAAAAVTGDAGAPDGLVARPDLARLEALLGTDRALVARALEALGRAGLLLVEPDAEPDGMRLAPAVLGPDPRSAGLDWRAVATATAGSPSAWVAAHALAERLDPYDWTPVARGGLEPVLGCGVSGVRAALERLVSADLVARREQRGGVSVYRFTDRAWGRGGAGAQAAPAVQPPQPAPRAAPPWVAPTAAASAAAAGVTSSVTPGSVPAAGLRLVLGGVELELPAGCRAHVTIGPDGRPTLTLAGPAGG